MQEGQHPYLWMMALWLLWSINERVGGNAGIEIASPDERWIEDLDWLRDIERERERERKQGGSGMFEQYQSGEE